MKRKMLVLVSFLTVMIMTFASGGFASAAASNDGIYEGGEFSFTYKEKNKNKPVKVVNYENPKNLEMKVEGQNVLFTFEDEEDQAVSISLETNPRNQKQTVSINNGKKFETKYTLEYDEEYQEMGVIFNFSGSTQGNPRYQTTGGLFAGWFAKTSDLKPVK